MTTKTWGPPTWIFLHCLAHKIKEEHFKELKGKIIELIVKICRNLPCPECAQHASIVMKHLKSENIHTKSDLEEMLFIFHNMVNERLEKNLYDEEELKMYDNYIFSVVIQNFFNSWKNFPHSQQMINNNFHKNILLRSLNNFFTIHFHKFDL